MSCQKCKSERIANLGAKCSDCCGVSIGNREQDGYVPNDLGIGGGDYVEFKFCLECGQIQGTWPRPLAKLEILPHCPHECGYQGMPDENVVEESAFERDQKIRRDRAFGYNAEPTRNKYKCPQCGETGSEEAWDLE